MKQEPTNNENKDNGRETQLPPFTDRARGEDSRKAADAGCPKADARANRSGKETSQSKGSNKSASSGALNPEAMEQAAQEKPGMMDELFGNVIYAYTRAQAIADGVLVDVTEPAKEAGFKHNTVVTQKLWADICKIPENYSYESKEGRLWDVLWMARCATGRAARGQTELLYELTLHTRNLDHHYDQVVELLLHVGPGDHGEPVITIGYQEDF